MKTIAVIRKPLNGTVAANVLAHGCGGLNIDASRIGVSKNVPSSASRTSRGFSVQGFSDGSLRNETGNEDGHNPKIGRFPANLILQHLDGCKQDGTKRVKSENPANKITRGGASTGLCYGDYGKRSLVGHADDDGKETLANWICEDGCPVKNLDEQTVENRTTEGSRFFKNIKEDLVSYLRDMITPPEGVVKVVPLDVLEPTGEDESVHGFIVMGTPTQEQANELLRICKPGGHVLLIAPEEQPTGHTGMCRMEDAGFEIRDTILLLLEASGFWYVPKTSKTEREAGCVDLRDGNKRGNSHPTVKPYAIMEALMKSVPKELPVVDPFMGSGSTGIAALHTGHAFIGIEREEDYMKIADARIRHWDQAAWRGHSVKIQSDVEKDTEADEDISLSDLFGSGG